MTLSVTFNARTDFPKVVPVLGTIPPRWDLKRAGALARELGTRTKVVDAGPRFGYLALPPTEPVPELSPVLELQGTLETEHQRYDFTRYVAAVEPGDQDGDRKLTNAHPALVIA